MNVYLIGFSGTGKSSVAEVLARRLGWTHFDSDDELVRRFGKPLDRVFAEDGEPAFRAAEREVVASTTREPRLVVSLGGGAFVDPDTRRVLDPFRVVRLVASPKEILRRLAADDSEVRPLLAAPDPLGRIRDLLARREAIYALAELTVDTEGLSPEEVAEWILAWLARSRESAGEGFGPHAKWDVSGRG
jgi:shikimate kinase